MAIIVWSSNWFEAESPYAENILYHDVILKSQYRLKIECIFYRDSSIFVEKKRFNQLIELQWEYNDKSEIGFNLYLHIKITNCKWLYIANHFKRQQSNHNLRNADYILPRFNTITYGKHSVKHLGPKIWARIPNNIKLVSWKT